MLREDMGGQKGETHDEEAITNKLKANGEARNFFFLKKKKIKLPYSCWIQNVHDGVFLSEWGRKLLIPILPYHFLGGKLIHERVGL